MLYGVTKIIRRVAAFWQLLFSKESIAHHLSSYVPPDVMMTSLDDTVNNEMEVKEYNPNDISLKED